MRDRVCERQNQSHALQMARQTEMDRLSRTKQDMEAEIARKQAALRDTIRLVNGEAGGIRAGAGDITQSSNKLSRRTKRLAGSLEETAAADHSSQDAKELSRLMNQFQIGDRSDVTPISARRPAAWNL